MSISGNGILSIRKRDVKESRSTSVAFRNLKFAHQANAGDTGIDITALTLPSAMTGFTNPSSAILVAANLRRYRDNLRIVSSLNGELIDYASYNVTATTINFNFTASQDEFFECYLSSNPTTGISVVSAQPIVATGELAIAATDFNVGALFTINANSAKQVGEVEVSRNGIQQFRCLDNDLTKEGNYIEVSNGTGLGQIIRFKNAPSGQDDSILVTSVSSLAEKPNDSQLAQIETIAGQVDRLVDVVSEELEIPSTTFQASANEPDLKQFGDRVLDLEQTKQDNFTTLAQAKTLPSNIVELNTTIAALTMNNLELGKLYRVKIQAFVSSPDANNVRLFALHDGNVLCEVQNEGASTSDDNMVAGSTSPVFSATADTITFVTAGMVGGGATDSINGNGTFAQTWVELEELPNYQLTTQWT